MTQSRTIAVALATLGLAGLSAADQEATTTLSLKSQGHHFKVVMTPSRPMAGHRVTLQLEVNEVPEVPDPTFGDRVPVRGASLVAVIELDVPDIGAPRDVPVKRFTMHPIGGAGLYGIHWTPMANGLYDFSVERRGEALPEAKFKLGVGVDTPKQEEASDAARRPGLGARIGVIGGGGTRRPERTVRGPVTPMAGGPSASKVMTEMAEPALFLAEAFAEKKPDRAALENNLKALVAAAAELPGTVPDKYRVGSPEYDALATDLSAQLGEAVALVAEGKIPQAKARWDGMLSGTCAQCHVKFWWAITPDLSSWPRIEAQPWKR